MKLMCLVLLASLNVMAGSMPSAKEVEKSIISNTEIQSLLSSIQKERLIECSYLDVGGIGNVKLSAETLEDGETLYHFIKVYDCEALHEKGDNVPYGKLTITGSTSLKGDSVLLEKIEIKPNL